MCGGGQTYRGCLNIWGVQTYGGIQTYRGHQNIRGHPNVWGFQTYRRGVPTYGASKQMGLSKHTGGIQKHRPSKHTGGESKHMGTSKCMGDCMNIGGHCDKTKHNFRNTDLVCTEFSLSMDFCVTLAGANQH